MASTTPQPSGEWQPLGSWDLVAIGFSSCVDTAAILLMLRVLANRRWPPYMTKIPDLVVCSALSVLFASLAVITRYGMLGSEGSTKPVLDCETEAWLLWLSAGAFVSCAFLRAYRYYKVLVCCDGSMWPAWAQLMVSMVLFSVPPGIYTRQSSMVVFDPVTQECEPQSTRPEVFALVVMVSLVVVSAILTFRLRVSYLQAPEEFQVAVAISTIMAFTVIIFPIVHVTMEDDRVGRRRVMLTATSLVTLCMLAPPFASIAVRGFTVSGGEDIERSDNYGLGTIIRPEDIRRMTRERMKINALVSSPGARDVPAASAMAWFYRDSLDRQLIQDYYLLQASTMRIIDTYVRPGAPMSVPISQRCRTTILRSKATSTFIFGRARHEIMTIMSSISVEDAAGEEDVESDTLAAGPSPVNESVMTEETVETTDPSPPQSAEQIESPWLEATAPVQTAASAEAPGEPPSRAAQRSRPSSRSAFGRILHSLTVSAETKVNQSMEISVSGVPNGGDSAGGGRGGGGEGGRKGGSGRWMKGTGFALSTRADVNQAFGLSRRDDDRDSSDEEVFQEYWTPKKNEELAGATESPVRGSGSGSRFPGTPDVRESMGVKKSPKSRKGFQHEQAFKETLDDLSDLEAESEEFYVVSNPLSSVSPSVFFSRGGE